MPTDAPTDVHPATQFELRAGDTWVDPWPMYSALRDHDPVHHVTARSPGHDYWVLSRHAHRKSMPPMICLP